MDRNNLKIRQAIRSDLPYVIRLIAEDDIVGWRALIEALMVSKELRGNRVGTAMMNHAIKRAKERDCRIVQLASNKQRPRAHRFYERLGFTSHHEGFKLEVEPQHKFTSG